MTKEEAAGIISGYEVYGCGYCLTGGDEVEEALRLAVDALRQETAIRCKDCKWSDTFKNVSEETATPLKCIGIRYGGVFPDWFCEHAERKEE